MDYWSISNELDQKDRVGQNVSQDVFIISLLEKLDEVGKITVAHNRCFFCKSLASGLKSFLNHIFRMIKKFGAYSFDVLFEDMRDFS